MRTSTRGLTLLLLTGLLGLFIGVVPASAHSRLLSITPADGAKLPQSPTEVVLTFNEPVNPQFVTVRITDSEGGNVVGQDATAQGAKVTLPVSDPIAAGTYNVVYRVVSADSHPISGSTSFTVGGNPQAPPASTTPSPSPSSTDAAAGSNSTGPSPSASASAAASDPTNSPQAAKLTIEDSVPVWVWALVALGLVGAIGGTFYAVRRDESHG